MSEWMARAKAERERIRLEYRRRAKKVDPARYAPWQPGEILMRDERNRIAATLLHRANVFPEAGDHCLEIGYGSLGWLGELISWGIRELDLHGIELESTHARRAQELLPTADLRVGDAVELPWQKESFQLVIISTVFSSILDSRVRQLIAEEVTRVLAPDGVLLCYDLAVNNPQNPYVKRIGRNELQRLFPTFDGIAKSLTLAPPVARWIARRSWVLATLASTIPLLRTHLLAVLIKRAMRNT